MKFAKIKNIKTKISRICLGTWGLGSSTKKTPSYGKISSKRAKEILIDAYKKKINFFDTAGVYGGGKSEDLIGEVFSPVRTKVIIATKVGCYDFNKKLDFSLSTSKELINTSLKRLKTNYLDIVQLHSPSEHDIKNEKIYETIDYLNYLKKKKIISCVGISLSSPSHLNLIKQTDFDLVQVNFNLMDQRIFELKQIKKFSKKIMVRTALNFGILTENFIKNKVKISTYDHRYKWSSEQLKLWKEHAYNYDEIMKKWNKKYNIQQNAIKFCLNFFNFINVGIMKNSELNHYINPYIFKKSSSKEIKTLRNYYISNTFFINKLKPKIKIKL